MKAIELADFPTILAAPVEIEKPYSEKIFHSKWVEQESLLKLPEIKCFVTHGGWGSLTEAVAAKVPMVCIPCCNDQGINADLIQDKKIGIKLGKIVGIGPPPTFFDSKVKSPEIAAGIKKVVHN